MIQGIRTSLKQYTPPGTGVYDPETVWVAQRANATTADPLLLYVHGAGQIGPLGMVSPNGPSTTALLMELAQYFTVAMMDLGGDQWGSDEHVNRIEAARLYMTATYGGNTTQPVTLVGESMGSLGSLNYLRANPTYVRAITAFIPVLDLNDFRSSQGAAGPAAIDPHYVGFVPGYGAKTQYIEQYDGPMHNPVTYASQLPDQSVVPIKLYYSDADAAIPVSYITRFVAARPSTLSMNCGSAGHTEPTIAAGTPDAVRFLRYLT